ncbi:MAG: sigma-54 dependent transcriptional regulator [Desulfobacterales bacterium]|nr:sigma-54 dependent transcriptional regulator [Desulfobacterales bacterium]
MKNNHILLVEDNHTDRETLSGALENWGYHVTTAIDGVDAVKKIKTSPFRLIIISFEITGISAFEILKTAKSECEDIESLFLSAHISVENAVEAMKEGALDFIIKPVDQSQLLHIVKTVFEDEQEVFGRSSRKASVKIVTENQNMTRLLDLARHVADSKASVLIQGESGTGKELFARFIHENSSRKNGPFVAINCGALPESLLESELFGHEKGAFTGAVARKPGRFELAAGGTILLDEITEMQIHLQAKLLRVLQESEIDRVGGVRPIQVDVRVVATTNRDIREAIELGHFREDLFYRLHVIPIQVPPLRERLDDIPLLTHFFIDKYNEIDGRNVKNLTKGALERLSTLNYKGNVRELENIIERAVLLATGVSISECDLHLDSVLYSPGTVSGAQAGASDDLMDVPLKEAEKKIIFHTLDRTKGNRTHAAKALGISVRTLRNKLNEYKENMKTV